MIKKFILRLLKVTDLSEELAQAERLRDWYKTKYDVKDTEIKRLELELLGKERLLTRRMVIVAADTGDPEPTEARAREQYVGEVANAYQGWMKRKLLQMIASVREELDTIAQNVPEGMDRTRFDDTLRGTSNAFKLLMDWAEMLSGEHQRNVAPAEDNE